MKKFTTIIFLLSLLSLSNMSCIRDNQGREVGERSITLHFALPRYTEETALRVAASSDDENLIRTAYVLLFGHDGRRLTQYPIKVNITGSGSATATYTASNITQGRVFVFVLANCAELVSGESDEESAAYPYETPSELLWTNSVSSIDDLKKTQTKLLINATSRSHSLVASKGQWYDLRVGNNNIDMQLERLDSKIQFNIQTDPLNSNLRFFPEQWRIVNIPRSKIPFYVEPASSPDDSRRSSADYYRAEDCPWQAFETNPNFPGATFTLYCPENRQPPRELINASKYLACTGKPGSDFGSLYRLRAYHIKTPSTTPGDESWRVSNGDFRFASPNATYVEFTGTLIHNNVQLGINREAKVKYTVLLGASQNHGDGKENDYFSLRNHHYTYTVTIRGADDIITEVQDNNLNSNSNIGNAGNKGEVRDIRVREKLDAHFGNFVLHIEKDRIRDLDKMFDFEVNTPYDSRGKRDVKWIQFYRNGKVGFSYDAGLEPRTAGNNPNQSLTIEQLRQEVKTNYNNPDFWDVNNRVTYSAYVNEYYYDTPPKDTQGNLLTNQYIPDWDTNGWRTFVNQPDRSLAIWYETKPQISADKQSSYFKPDIYITQRAIRTIYNVNEVPQGAVIWGFETIDEHPTVNHTYNPLMAGGFNLGTSVIYNPKSVEGLKEYTTGRLFNGYAMSLYGYGLVENDYDINAAFKEKEWSFFRRIDDDHYQTPEDQLTRSAQYQCMVRNDDINGDGKVNENEFRWYLPAQGQLLNMYILASALSPQHRLAGPQYDYDTYTYKNLFLSSTLSNSGNMTVNFAIEGSPTGLTNDASDQSYVPLGSKQLSIRCVRPLGGKPSRKTFYSAIKVYGKPGSQWRSPRYYANWQNGESSNYSFIDKPEWYNNMALYIDLSGANPSALRNDYIAFGNLPKHSRLSHWNKPYKAFRVAMQVPQREWEYSYNDLITTNQCNSYEEKDADGTIVRGWRIPSEKELAIMMNYIPWGGGSNTRGWLYTSGVSLFYTHVAATYYDDSYARIYITKDTKDWLNIMRLYPVSGGSDYVTTRCVKDWNKPIPK